MCKLFVPYGHASNIYDIDISFYKKLNLKAVIMDLDNTLDSYKLYKPSERAVTYINSLIEAGIKPIIVSNNKGHRVSSYANALGVEYISSARKPFPFKLKEQIAIRNLKNDEVIFIGDQLLTDVIATKGAHIRCILTEKLVKEDQWTTHVNRVFDRPIRKLLKLRHKLIDWRDL